MQCSLFTRKAPCKHNRLHRCGRCLAEIRMSERYTNEQLRLIEEQVKAIRSAERGPKW